MKAKVIKAFRDLKAGEVVRHADEVFELTQERFDEIDGIIPGYIELYEADPEPAGDSAEEAGTATGGTGDAEPTMDDTKAEICAYLDAHGIEYDKRAKKADLLALIG